MNKKKDHLKAALNALEKINEWKQTAEAELQAAKRIEEADNSE